MSTQSGGHKTLALEVAEHLESGHRVKRIMAGDAEHLRVTLEFTDGFRGTVHLTAFFRKSGR
ncbi:MAG: hypothetical protein ABIR79_25350 [Candidatus Binatia bacterium]